MAFKDWPRSANSAGKPCTGRRVVSDCADTPAASLVMRRKGRKLTRAAQAPSSAVASADRPTVNQISPCMRCRKCW